MKKEALKDLLQRFGSGDCTEEEKTWVENWYLEQDADQPLPVSSEKLEASLKDVYRRLPKASQDSSRFRWIKVAAILSFLFVSIGLMVYFQGDRLLGSKDQQHLSKTDIEPGRNKATLTLANGTVIFLDELAPGDVYLDSELSIRKTKDGEIEYIAKASAEPSKDRAIFNQVNTPAGGQYQITLPDGTKVWLNAGSTLKYPTRFSAEERVVELEGEAYFEVSKASVPFYVQTADQQVKVLGTHFNVNAYKEEAGTKTTLLEGSVQVTFSENGKAIPQKDVILRPGQESWVEKDKDILVTQGSTKQAIAWKNGFFNFENADLKSVMREFSRWYGVEVRFEGVIPNTRLWGEIDRNVPASQALDILRYYDLKFIILENRGVSSIEISSRGNN